MPMLQHSRDVEVRYPVCESHLDSGDLITRNRANGQGELYTYLPPTDANDAILAKIPPQSIRNTDYGYSIGRGAFNFNNAVGELVPRLGRIHFS